jgi:proline racemase
MDRLTQLQNRYLELTNKVLPQIAEARQFPVKHNHCFGRIILDNLFGCCWYEVLERKQKAAYKQLTEEQLSRAIALAEAMIARLNEYIVQLNHNSLRWRGKLVSLM